MLSYRSESTLSLPPKGEGQGVSDGLAHGTGNECKPSDGKKEANQATSCI